MIVLAVSSLLNGCYFLPILTKAWFGKQQGPWPEEQYISRFETRLMLLVPPLVTAFIVMVAGLVANAQVSPLAWVRFIVREYGL